MRRLIDANALEKDMRAYADNKAYCGHIELANGILKAVGRIDKAPTVDAVELPCKIDDDVYIIPSKVNFKLNVLSGLVENNRVYHQKVAEIVFLKDCWYVTGGADKEYGTGKILLDRFYKETWFLTLEEAEAALAKMDGDGNG